MNPWQALRPKGCALIVAALFATLSCCSLKVHANSIGSEQEKSTPQLQELMIAVHINSQEASEFAVLVHDGERYFATASDISQWRLRLPANPPIRWKGEDYFPLDNIVGISMRLDTSSQILYLQVPAAAFVSSSIQATEGQTNKINTAEPGLFVNHDFQFLRAGGNSAFTGSVEMGAFSGMGVVTAQMIARDLLQSPHWARLDTQFVRDYPARMASFTVGDAISTPNPWALQVHYSGIRWASKFSTQPSFVSVALPSAAGEVTVPSLVDIYVNNTRVSEQQIDPGPFEIQNVPVVSGQGDIRMVITDALGRKQILNQPYIRAATLLRKGISEYGYEGGTLRFGFGTPHSGYTSAFLAATQRYGWSHSLTLSGRVEITGNSQTIGAGADTAILGVGAFSGAVALSHGAQGGGGLVYGQFENQRGPFSFTANVAAASSSFRQLGLLSTERAPRLNVQGSLSQRLGKKLTLAVGYLRREGRSHIGVQHDSTIADISGITSALNWRVNSKVTVTSSMNYAPGSANRITANLGLIIPLGTRDLAMVSSDIDKTTSTATLDYSRQVPAGPGLGYRFRADVADNKSINAGVYAQNGLGNYLIEAAETSTGATWRLGETSSVVLFHRKIIPARWLYDSFAVVDVPQRGIKVLANNQYVGTIGRRGFVLLPSIAPYSANAIRLDDQSVPVDLQINLEEKQIVPMPRSGVYVKFTAEKSRGALLVLVTEDEKPVPLGALVFANNSDNSDMVAMHGEVFVQSIALPGQVKVRWGENECDVAVPVSPDNEPLPRIGPLVCKKVK